MKLSGVIRWTAVVIAVAVYVFFRLRGLTDVCLWFDEIFSVHAATMSFADMLAFVRLDLIHPPLFYILLKFWIMAGGESLLWLRLFPFVFSVLALIPLWLAMRELKLSAASVVGVIVMVAVNGALVRYSQEVRMYAPFLFFGALSMWLFTRFFLLGKNIWLLGIVNLLLVHTHYFGWVVVLSEIAVIALLQRIKIRPSLIMLGGVFAAFLPWLVYVLRAPRVDDGIGRNIGWISRPDIGAILRLPLKFVEPLYYPFQNIDPHSVYAVAVPLLAIVAALFIFAVRELRRSSPDVRSGFLLPLILASFPVGVALIASWIMPYSVWGVRHLIIAFLPFAIATGAAFGALSKNSVRIAAGAAFLLIIAAGVLIDFGRERAMITECAWEDMANRLPAGSGGDVYVFEDVAAYDVWFALRRRGAEYGVVKLTHPQIAEDKAFFLPRGFDEVRRAESFTGDRFHVMFRDRWYDTARPPLHDLRDLGYKIGQPEVVDLKNERVFLVEISR